MSDAKLAILPLGVWSEILMLLIVFEVISLRLVTKMSADIATISSN